MSMLPKPHRHAWMTTELDAFRDQVRRYIEGEIAPRLEGWRRDGYIPRDVWRGFGEMGFLLPEIEETYGGAGAGPAYQMVVQEEMALAEVGPHVTVHSIATHYIADYGTQAQKQRWLPRLVGGEMFAGIAMTEPGCGSDLKALRTRARRDGDDWVIDGAKTFITNGYTGNLLVVAARTADEGSRGVSLFVLETENLPGFRVGRRLEKIGQHTSDTVELFFDGVRVPAQNLLGEEGRGFAQLMTQLPYERLLIAVNAVANIERAVALTVEYTQGRRAFGQTLYDLQNTRLKLAECATVAHVARCFVNDCIQRLIDGCLDKEAAYMAKCWCAEQLCQVADECLQLFGGYGYTTEYPIARIYADARVMRIYGGASEVLKDLIARQLAA
jgi:acyl-CoA dehydrogenase